MIRNLLLRLPVGLSLLLLAITSNSAPHGDALSLTPHVDERVELLSIVFRLAGNSEYNMNLLPGYSADIDKYFASYKDHPAVLLAKKVAEQQNGVGYDAVMAMAIHLTPPPALSPVIPLTDQIPDPRWGKSNAMQFAEALRDFYRDTNFEKFFASHHAMYQLAESRFGVILKDLDLDWYKNFYGEAPRGHFNVVLGVNNGGGNYGPKVVFPDGHQELYAIISCAAKDDSGNPTFDAYSLPTLIHEFNHSFVNPVIEDHKDDFATADQVYQPVADAMKSMAYGSSKIMVDESLVRAAVILYFESHDKKPAEVKEMIVGEEGNGFVWMDELCDLLRQFESQRTVYPTFASFVPKIAAYYRSLAARIPQEIASFDQQCVHVTGMTPFPNHSTDADSAAKEIVLTFDKPLVPGNYSMNYGPDGKDHWPITGNPEFLAGNTSIKLHVELKPNCTYGVLLTGRAFRSPDGYPLKPYLIAFKTKQ